MKCKCHPDSPFLWARTPRDSMFMNDPVFKPKGSSGLTTSQLASVVVEDKRKEGKMTGSIANLGRGSKQKELAMIAYKQFGIYSRAQPSVKPTLNKHELPKGKL